ncbi:MAG: Hint domain-containing protein [Paracoccaceae bacterium]
MADILLGGIIINEILADPNTSATSGFDTNQDGSFDNEDEFVEIRNISGAAIDIGGFQLWDAGQGNWFTFPLGTSLQAGAHAMVMTGFEGATLTGAPGDLFFYAERGSAVINNGAENVVLFDPGSDQYISATYNGDSLDDPTDYSGFPSPTATRSGSGEDFGSDNDGSSIQRSVLDDDVFINDETPTPGTVNICFTAGTLFETAQGSVAIERIRPGDMIKTHDGRFIPVKWIWAQRRTASDLRQDSKLWPVEIKRNAFGAGVPNRDVRVSQHHRLMVSSNVAERMFDHHEVLVPAKDLLDIEGVRLVDDCAAVTYFHILFETHEVVLANGIPAESLFLGPEALKSLHPDALDEICRIFQTTRQQFLDIDYRTKWFFASGKKVRKMAARHVKNTQPLYGYTQEVVPKLGHFARRS